MVDLTDQEKDELAKKLAFSARSGGWFLMIMGLFVAGMIVAAALSVFKFDRLEPEVAGPMLLLAGGFFGVGGWLLNRRRVIRRELDDILRVGRGEVIEAAGPSDTGWEIKMRVQTPSGFETAGGITGYGPPPWQVGESVELLFFDDEERFFPRELSFNASMGTIHKTVKKERNNRIATVFYIVIGVLFCIGLIVGILESLGG